MIPLDECRSGDSLRLRAFGFDDVHPLWGGRALWVSDDLSAEVRVIDRAGSERRRRRTIAAEEWSEVERLVAESGILVASIPQRNGVPDEGIPSIRLITASGEELVFSKWDNDTVPSFDSVFEHLRSMAGRIENQD